jgi:hypothetical protein
MTIIENMTLSYGKVINVITFYIESVDEKTEIQNIKKIDKDEFILKTPFILSSEEMLFLIKNNKKKQNSSYIFDSVFSFDINASVNEINANHLDHFTTYKDENCLKDIHFNIIKSRITKYNSVIIFLKKQTIQKVNNIKSSLKTSKTKGILKANKQTKKVRFKL